jgi:peroxiredoxin
MISKKLLIATLAISTLSAGAIQAQTNTKKTVKQEFILDGEIYKGPKSLYIFRMQDGRPALVDSTKVSKNKFTIKGDISTPEMIYVSVDKKSRLPLFVENGSFKVAITGNHSDSLTISGSQSNDDMMAFNKKLAKYDDAISELMVRYRETKDQDAINELEKEYDGLDDTKSNFIKEFIRSNSASYISPYLITRYMTFGTEAEELTAALNMLDVSVSNSIYINEIKDRIKDLEKTKKGNKIQAFSLPDADGKEISIKDFEGKYVLIDFWASWCGPCRRENPNVVAAYEKYNDKNFTILGVSLDNNKEKWLAAIEKDGLTWSHISDLKGWDNAVAKDFGVRGIPFSILIDPNGVVLEKNLRGEALQEFLEKTLK